MRSGQRGVCISRFPATSRRENHNRPLMRLADATRDQLASRQAYSRRRLLRARQACQPKETSQKKGEPFSHGAFSVVPTLVIAPTLKPIPKGWKERTPLASSWPSAKSVPIPPALSQNVLGTEKLCPFSATFFRSDRKVNGRRVLSLSLGSSRAALLGIFEIVLRGHFLPNARQ